ncbi:hypothetical protein U9M48_032422 [Paspalum notatum var. saurae]|uniref:Secreted protein n=1 Tax=Paspalum notatum var. saurae TaxID=547442 RepID=A0AAQ3U536_PASNO
MTNTAFCWLIVCLISSEGPSRASGSRASCTISLRMFPSASNKFVMEEELEKLCMSFKCLPTSIFSCSTDTCKPELSSTTLSFSDYA